MTTVMLMLGGCGSSPPKEKYPLSDENLERFNRAGRLAFDKGRLQQAANFYRKALEHAYERDDTAAILDAQYNLAICLMDLQSYEAALKVVRQANSEMALAGQGHSLDFLLLEATILYRHGDRYAARQATDQILAAPTPVDSVIAGKTHFLRGMIASEQGDLDQLRASIAALGEPQEIQLRADRQELLGRLAMAEKNWDAAVDAFDDAAGLRREVLDYRGMIKVLALAGAASQKTGRTKDAAVYYLKAGRSAFWQERFDDAQIWLNQAAQLADTVGEVNTIDDARSLLWQIEAQKP